VDKDKLLHTVYKAHPRRHLQHKNETAQKDSEVSEEKTSEEIQEENTEKPPSKYRPPAGGFMLPANFDMSQARNTLKKSAKTENSETSFDETPSAVKQTQTFSPAGVKRPSTSENNVEQELRKKISELEEERKRWEAEKKRR